MKKLKVFSYLTVMLFALSLIITSPSAYAKGGGGGGGSGRGGGFSGGARSVSSGGGIKSSGFSGGAKSNSSITTPATAPKSQSGFSGGPKTPPAPVVNAPAPKSLNGFSGGPKTVTAEKAASVAATKPVTPTRDAAAAAKTVSISREQSQKAMADYKAQQAKFNPPPSNTSISASPNVQQAVVRNVVVKNYHYDSGSYAYRTNSFYVGHGWNAPVYAQVFYPNYGLWNTMSLLYMMDHVEDHQYAMMYLSHRNDADMLKWREQADREAQSNAELKAKLATMDARVKAMEQQGVKADPSYVPPEMEDIALSEDILKNADSKPVAPTVTQAQSPTHKSNWILWTFLSLVAGGGLFWLLFKRKW
ncbi:MAG: hypothetical protein WC823_00600 [Parcubacteria group bacterium]|jgi:hypothetical protein